MPGTRTAGLGSTETPVNRGRGWGWRTVELAVYLILALALQWARGDWSGGWSGWPDESGHFVTGLMVHDYLNGHLLEAPMRFAETYYDHYQKVMLGHWPPLFYLLHGIWYFFLGPSLVAALWLMALVTASIALFISLETRRFAPRLAFAAGVIWLFLPQVRTAGEKVFAELVVALFMFLAVRAYARYLERNEWWQSALFAVFAAGAILTKGTGLALAAVPVVAIMATGKWRLLRQPSFWAPGAVVAVLCLPWYLLAPGARHEKVLLYGGPQFQEDRIPAFFSFLRELFPLPAWPVMAAVFAWGMTKLRSWPFAATTLGLVLGMFAGNTGIRVWETRHLIALGPPLLVMAAYALKACLPEFPRRPIEAFAGLAALVLFIAYCVKLDQPIDRHPNDYRQAAAIAHEYPAVLVTGRGDFEGDFTADYALLEPRRPMGTVLRAGKVLVDSDMRGLHYTMKLSVPEGIRAYLRSRRVGLIAVDQLPGLEQPDVEAVRAFLAAYSAEWERVPVANPRVALYRLSGAAQK